MNWTQNSKQILAGITFGFLVVTGTYNAVVINSESTISGYDVRFAKRLDEVYGKEIAGREVAASIKWQKISTKRAAILKQKVVQNNIVESKKQEPAAPVEVVAQAAVQEELNLGLTEVINPKKWQQGLTNNNFNGSLVTSNGVIESLNVSLPNDEGLSVSFSEMTGNVFEYDYNGELYSGMMYQVDTSSYMVTLTNGPLEGTRLKFSAAPAEEVYQPEQAPQNMAQNEVQPEQAPQEMLPVENPENFQAQDIYSQEQAQVEQNQQQGYNFEMQQAM